MSALQRRSGRAGTVWAPDDVIHEKEEETTAGPKICTDEKLGSKETESCVALDARSSNSCMKPGISV